MDPYLTHLTDILALCVTWAVGGLLLLAGAGLTGNRGAPEFQIAAGWGAFCLLLTSWGVFVPLSMRLPAVAFGIAALGMERVRVRPRVDLAYRGADARRGIDLLRLGIDED